MKEFCASLGFGSVILLAAYGVATILIQLTLEPPYDQGYRHGRSAGALEQSIKDLDDIRKCGSQPTHTVKLGEMIVVDGKTVWVVPNNWGDGWIKPEPETVKDDQ